MLNYLPADVPLAAVRLTAPSIGTQDLQLVESPGRNNQGATITIRLGPTRRLGGRVRDRSGQPGAGEVVEVWSRGSDFLPSSRVDFQDGPLRTAADGSFRTPENLLVGSTYLVTVRAPGFETISSKWITIGDQPPLSLPMLQTPLRTVRGRVVDRQGKPLLGVEVFQSGDGPERTATKTDGDGRFALDGFREGPVFLFARRDGFRFFGRPVKPGEAEIAVELIRIGERPAQELRTLPLPIPQEESRALARRVVGPCWEAAVAQNDEIGAYRALTILAKVIPSKSCRNCKPSGLFRRAGFRSSSKRWLMPSPRVTWPGQRLWPIRSSRPCFGALHSGRSHTNFQQRRAIASSPCWRAPRTRPRPQNPRFDWSWPLGACLSRERRKKRGAWSLNMFARGRSTLRSGWYSAPCWPESIHVRR
jgi:hypothetical protein